MYWSTKEVLGNCVCSADWERPKLHTRSKDEIRRIVVKTRYGQDISNHVTLTGVFTNQLISTSTFTIVTTVCVVTSLVTAVAGCLVLCWRACGVTFIDVCWAKINRISIHNDRVSLVLNHNLFATWQIEM